MRKIVSIFCICLILASPFTAYAESFPDPAKSSSLTLKYGQGGEYFEGLEIKTYCVAEALADGTFALAQDFKDYPVAISGITSQSKWNEIAATLSAYIAADAVSPNCKGVTDSEGTVAFTDILPGLYLTSSVKVESQKAVTVFCDFLTAVPYPQENGEYTYDVVAYPKCEIFIPKEEKIEYKVVKQWKDSGHTTRPEHIQVDIFKDGVLQSTQPLSADNNWCYRWTAADDGSRWQAVERVIPDDYTVTIVEKGNTIIITNTYDDENEDLPQTGDTTAMWPYVLAMGFSGSVLIMLAIWRKRAEK